MKLVFVYTLKCNAECEICCFNCTPHETEKINYETVSRLIKEAAETKAFNEISITGGEALLYRNEVESLIELSNSYKFRTILTTNAFWAKSIDAAYETLYKLKEIGLSLLSVSTDEFHNKFIPTEFVENLIIANEKVKIPITFQSVVTRKTTYEHKLIKKYPNYTWRKGLCQPVGRAVKTIPSEDYIYSKYDGKCIYSDILTIMPDGSCYPCCSQGVRLDNLKIGSVYEQSLQDLIKAKKNHKFTKIMIYRGPKWLIETGEAEGHYLSNPMKNYVSCCHLCHEISKDKVYLEKVKNIIENTFFQISYSQLLKVSHYNKPY